MPLRLRRPAKHSNTKAAETTPAPSPAILALTTAGFGVTIVNTLEADAAPGVPVGGANVAVAPVGSPDALSVTTPVNGFVEATLASVMLYTALDPPLPLRPAVKPTHSKSGGTGTASPVPLSVPVCGDPAALSATLTVALSAVAEPGVNVTAIAQLAPAASVAPQVVVCANDPAFVPPNVMPEIFSVAFPGFESVKLCDALVVATVCAANVSPAGVSTACGAGGAVPVPFRLPVCGEPTALSATFTAALNVPADDGLNVTTIEQFAPAASVAPHVELCAMAKLLALAPPIVIPRYSEQHCHYWQA